MPTARTRRDRAGSMQARPAPGGDRPRAAIAIATLAYLAFVAYQSLAGDGFGACVAPLVQQDAHLSGTDGLANVVAYLPLGLLAAAWADSRRPGAAPALLLGLVSISAFSLAMELVQACLPGRVSSWYDWSTNTLGALLGLLAMPAARRAARIAHRHPALARVLDAPLLWPAALCIGTWLAMTTAPWRFTFDPGTIRGNLAFVVHASQSLAPDAWRLARHLFGWLAVGGAVRAMLPDRRAAAGVLVLLIGASALAQPLLVWHALSPEELGAMVLAAIAFAAASPRLADAALARATWIAALASVTAYELAPGAGEGFASGFSWWPQLGRGGLLGALELALLYCWLAFTLVLSLRWSARQGRDISRQRVVLPLAVVVALLAMEVAQRWIPGRSPDTSAPLITGLAFAVAWTLGASVKDRVRPTSRRRAA